MNTTRKLYASVLPALLFFSTFPLATDPAEAAIAAGTGLEIVDHNYVKIPDGKDHFGQGAVLYVKLTDPSRPDLTPAPEVITASVKSDTAAGAALSGPFAFNLLETGPTTGIFTGSLNVGEAISGFAAAAPADLHPFYGSIYGDTKLVVQDRSKITVTVGTTFTDSIVWRRSETADIFIERPNPGASPPFVDLPTATPIRGFGDSIRFRIRDADLNTRATNPPEEYSNLIRVFSDSDPVGEFVRLVESTTATEPPVATPSSSTFVGVLTFEADLIPNNGKLYVRHGDRVRAIIQEAADNLGLARTIEKPDLELSTGIDYWPFQTTTDGATIFFLPSYSGIDANNDGVYENEAVILVSDLDQSLDSAGSDAVTVAVSSTSNPTPRNIQLRELGGLTGFFVGSVGFVKPEPAGPSDSALATDPRLQDPDGFGPLSARYLRVSNGDTIAVAYTDGTDQFGTTRTRTATSRFFGTSNATIQLGPTSTTPLLVGTHSSHSIILNDVDANANPLAQETVTVRVKTSSDPEVGLAVTLIETQENSATFVGSFAFSTSSTGAGRVRVADRDLVVVEYNDPKLFDGTSGRIQSNRATWRAPSEAQVSFDSPNYARAAPRNVADGLFNQVARVIVVDQDQNDPFVQDTVKVSVAVSSAPAGQSALIGKGILDVPAIEVGKDTGIFIANIPFGRENKNAPDSAFPRFDPRDGANDAVAFSAGITAEYLDPIAPSANNAALPIFSTPSTWYEQTTLRRFETVQVPSATNLPERRSVVAHLTGDNANTRVVAVAYSTASPGSITVSTAVPCSYSQTFNEEPAGSGRWVSAFDLTNDVGPVSNTCSVSGRVRIRAVTTSTTDTVTLSGGAALDNLIVRLRVPASADWTNAARSGPASDAFGFNALAYVTMNAPHENQDRHGIDLALVEVRQTTSVEGRGSAGGNPHAVQHFVAVEDGPDTGRFVTAVGYTTPEFQRATIVGPTDPHVTKATPLLSMPGTRAPRICYWESTRGAQTPQTTPSQANPHAYPSISNSEPLYLKIDPNALPTISASDIVPNGVLCGRVAAGDIRLTPSRNMAGSGAFQSNYYPAGTIVMPSDGDVGTELIFTRFDYTAHESTTPTIVTRFAYRDQNATPGFDAPNPSATANTEKAGDTLYVDIDGTSTVTIDSPSDVRLSRNVLASSTAFTFREPYSLPAEGHTDCDSDGSTATTSCGSPKPLVPYTTATAVRFADLDGDGVYSYRDAVYLVTKGANTQVEVGHYRFATLATQRPLAIEVQQPLSRFREELYPARLWASIPENTAVHAQELARTSFQRWYPGSDPVYSTTPGFGAAVRARVQIQDDAVAGYRFRDQFTQSGGQKIYNPGGSVHADSPIVYVTRTDTITGATSPASPYTVAAVNTQGADIPITDRNGDGLVSCADLTYPGTVTCTSKETDLLSGQFHFTCPNSQTSNCLSSLSYQYMARAVSSFSTSSSSSSFPSQYIYSTAGNQIEFGVAPATGSTITIDSRRSSLPVLVRSEQTGEEESILFPIVNGQYTADLSVEFNRINNNGLVHVRPGAGHRDRFLIVYKDTATGSGLPGSDRVNHFLSSIGIATWFETSEGQLSFRTPTFQQVAASPFFGPFLPIQVVDIDADRTNQPDTMTVVVRNAGNAADRVTVTLRETGPETATFWGVVPIVPASCGCPEPDTNINIPNPPGTITIDYADPAGPTGTPSTVRTSIGWRPSATATLVVSKTPTTFPSPTATPAPLLLRGTEDALYVQVADPDANKDSAVIDTLTVTVTSQSDAVGETITLFETTPSSGVFRSPGIRFETTLVPNNGKVYALDTLGALDGETIRVRYEDPQNNQGVRQIIGARDPIRWDRTFDGIVTFDRTNFIGAIGPGPDDGPSGTIRFGNVYVADGDLNADPKRVERPTVSAGALLIGRVAGTGQFQPGSEVQIQLFETGANTGVFMGRFSFATSTGKADEANGALIGTSASVVGQVGMGPDGNTFKIRAVYEDKAAGTGKGDGRGQDASFSTEADWVRAGVGVVRFDRAGYNSRSLSPEITLWDQHLDTSSARQSVQVQVKSNADTAGITITLQEDASGANVFSTGRFRATIGLNEGASTTGRIRVGSVDIIQAIYTDQTPSGTRSATAAISVDDVTPPVTTLATSPAAPDGLRGAFTSIPTLTLSANEFVQNSFVRLGAGGSPQAYTGPFALPEGVHTVGYWSVDAVGNAEAERTRSFVVDLSNPTIPVTGLKAEPRSGGSIRINWTAIPLTTNPLNFHEYVVYRDADLVNVLRNTTALEHTDTTLTDENPHLYRVAVRDLSGRVGPISASVTARPDATAPTLSGAIVDPSGFDVRTARKTVSVSVVATDANLAKVTARLQLPSLEPVNTTQLVRSGTSNVYQGTLNVTGLTQPCACLVVFNATDTVGNSRTLSSPLTVTGPDTEAPEIAFPGIVSGRVERGDDLSVKVTDNVGLQAVEYSVNGGPFVGVPVTPDGASTFTFVVPTADLLLGTHVLEVVARDNARDANGTARPNEATATQSFELALPEDGPGPGTQSLFLPTTAERRSDGTIQVTWTIPPDLDPTSARSFQVWRSSSPFTLVANITDPDSRSFVDVTAIAGRVYRYVVTAVPAASLGFSQLSAVPGYVSDSQVPASGPVSVDDGGVPRWLWAVFASLGLLALGILVAVAIVSRRSRAQTTTLMDESPAETAEDGTESWPQEDGRHVIRCPSCEHRFEVVGNKPLITDCPNCGRRGVLR